MTVRELMERLAAYPEYWEVMAGPAYVTEVDDRTIVQRAGERHGGSAVSAFVVVVIQ